MLPGHTANPKGRARVPQEVRDILRAASPKAAKRLVRLMRNNDPNVSLKACSRVLELVLGKNASLADDEEDDARALPLGLTVEELMRLALNDGAH